jgi:hypothetical protein
LTNFACSLGSFITNIHVEESKTISTPPCSACEGPTRIYGIEPHLRLAHTDIHTYVCDACDTSQILVVPLPARLKA